MKTRELKLSMTNFMHNKKTPFICFLMCLMFILLYLICILLLNIYYGKNSSIEFWVENSVLTLCLLIIVLTYDKVSFHFTETLVGELLVIFTVTYISSTIEVINNAIENGFDYIRIFYLILEILISVAGILLFVDHLISHEKSKSERFTDNIANYASLVVVVLTLVDIVLIILTNDNFYKMYFINELSFLIFFFFLIVGIRSLENSRHEK